MKTLKQKIANYATQDLGLDDCRFTSADTSQFMEIYDLWLKAGRHGEMDYLLKHQDLKEHPEKLLSGVRSAIVVMKNYKSTHERRLAGNFKIARYAVGADYHAILAEKLNALADVLKKESPQAQCYCGVDSRPIPERSLGIQAGVGFLGKNTMLIKPGMGSYFYLGVVLTTVDFEPDAPLRWDCGSCRLCIDACPTQALLGDFQMDAAKCISYQTIEQKEPMSETQIRQAQGWIYGCDICQEVCPYNHDRIPLTNWSEFLPEAGVGFKFFEKAPDDLKEQDIPKTSPMHRSRRRIIPNFQLARRIESAKMKH